MADRKRRHEALTVLLVAIEHSRLRLEAIHEDWNEQFGEKSERWRLSQYGADVEIQIEELSDACDSLAAAMDSIRASMVMKGGK